MDGEIVLDSEFELFKSLWDLVDHLLLHGGAAWALHSGALLPTDGLERETATQNGQAGALKAVGRSMCIGAQPLARIVWRRKMEVTATASMDDELNFPDSAFWWGPI